MDEPPNVAWEYKPLSLPFPVSGDMESALERRLNEMGELGWDLVCVTPAYVNGQPPMLHAYFKRRLR